MVGLSRTTTIDSLLSRFRPASPVYYPPTAVMVALTAPPPLSNTREIVLRRNATQQDTRT
jgi:hypothetical protein